MKVIKFRAWDDINKCLVNVKKLHLGNKIKVEHDKSEWDWYQKEVPVMQFTGVHDKNGVEIYEGDIYQYAVEININGNISKKYCTDVVKFSNGTFQVGEEYLFDALEHDDDPKILGNIYENPELLEVPEC